jgi:calcineurin-binding protein cabin-1
LKQSGKIDYALGLFEDLLRTNVIYDVGNDKDNKLFLVKYNCHRNIGLIYEEKKEYKLALKALHQAIILDDSDVYTLNKLGKIALELNSLMLSKWAFERCLELNPNHFSAKDCYLQCVCKMELIDEAYAFAFKSYAEDKHFERAARVLMEIRDRMRGCLDYYDGIYGEPDLKNCPFEQDDTKSVFPEYKEIGFMEESYAVLPDDFKIKEEDISWLSIGKLILKVHNHIIENNNVSYISLISINNLLI